MTGKRQDLLNLLCDLSDLSALVAGSEDIENFLQRTAAMVSRHLETPVCSIYLYDETADELVLNATVGLNPKAVNRVRMPPGQGLVGTVMATQRPVREGRAGRNPHFRYFPETDELAFESFLAVPIQKGEVKIGVLVVQHTESDYFEPADVTALKATGAQLAAALENARLLMDLQRLCRRPQKATRRLGFIKGQRASGGYAFGHSLVWRKSHGHLLDDDGASEAGDIADFHRAVKRTAEQLDLLQHRCAQRLPESASLIFAAHLMMLKDPQFIDRMARKIEAGAAATTVVRQVAGHYIDLFSNSPHPYIREKVDDIGDLAGRLLSNIVPKSAGQGGSVSGKVVVAGRLYPSELLKLAAESVAGIVMVNGGVTSHASIIARSLKIPLVMAPCPDLLHLPPGTPVIVDGDAGNVYVNPAPEIRKRFEARNHAHARVTAGRMPPVGGHVTTADGQSVRLLANINLLAELSLTRQVGAAGIGLYRTEFPFLIRPSFPSETEQYLVYRQVVSAMAGKPVVFRTLDIGGEKAMAYADSIDEPNPELGLRSIRFTLAFRDVFEQQIRAILRAASDVDAVGIMFPLVSSMEEFVQARQIVRDCMRMLAQEGLAHHPRPAVGMMVELPSVVETMAELAAEADFFSVGTNDLVQYMLGVDRSNKRVAQYYLNEHPAVLRVLARIVRTAAQRDKPVSICGEMAHDPAMLPFLLGIGVREFSLDPQFIPSVGAHLARLRATTCRDLADKVIAVGTVAEVRRILARHNRD